MSDFASAFVDAAAEPATSPEPPAEQSKPAGPTVATRLVRMGELRYRLGVTPDGEPFAVERGGRQQHVALMLRGGRLGLRQQLASSYFELEGKAPPSSALADALTVLDGKAHRLEPVALATRVAEADGAVWIDSGRTDGTVFKITPDAVEVLHEAPMLFRRTALTDEMPLPEPGGSLDELWQFLNVAPADRPLLLAALVAALRPGIPHPIPTLTGEQGTGKSTAAAMLAQLLDPSPVPLRKPPRDVDGFTTALSGSWVAALDNISTVPDWLSDALCRAVTGDGDVRRQLYTDGDLAVFSFRRQLLLTGIDFAGLRGDLAERLLLIELHRITDEQRRDEESLQAAWKAAHARLLGALFRFAAQVLRALPDVQLAALPRMADYARVLAAVDRLLGTNGLAYYRSQAASIASDTLTASPFTVQLLEMKLDFVGTSAELLDLVRPADPEWRAPKTWPESPRAVTSLLRRDAPALRKNGWDADDLGTNRDGTKQWHIRHPEHECLHGL